MIDDLECAVSEEMNEWASQGSERAGYSREILVTREETGLGSCRGSCAASSGTSSYACVRSERIFWTNPRTA
ncbi:hypothetical protein P691DRAFT_802741 [Macrolepiota fuliginosa MF-IS2]|uniref:Uncharacterized protein n=1 Tax=Macrolepiota fuliginosa MF-IS2 TaxID=1400762 RepID=A0A9P6BUL9_9AGAR|nr:hypothetical protein P691DRAFT_802741 [Macrolepiota fuliginosa MF-IS2]